MKCAVIAYILVLALFLSGCGTLMDGEFVWQQYHQIQTAPNTPENIAAQNYSQLYNALESCVEKGRAHITISVGLYDRETLEKDVDRAVDAVCAGNPVAAYAVQQITWELGSGGGEMVLSIQVEYIHDQNQINRILAVADNTLAVKAIQDALIACDSGIVLRIKDYEEADFVQIVEDFAMEHPEYVIETPQVTANTYPQTGSDRVLELKFVYQTSRDTLRNMQTQVGTLFDAAVNMVSVTVQPREKYAQMYSLMMERFQRYSIETSLTPAYSVLVHGVGDAKAFATVYAAICREADLECFVVTGKCSGEYWYWNIICIDGVYYHVDLLRSEAEGAFREMTDSIIDEGYVWNFSAYPVCGPQEPAEEGNEDTEK